jgi:hypothetical protein
VVTVNPTTGATTFTDGAATVCQDALNETYTATAANSTSIAYSVLPAAAGTITKEWPQGKKFETGLYYDEGAAANCLTEMTYK